MITDENQYSNYNELSQRTVEKVQSHSYSSTMISTFRLPSFQPWLPFSQSSTIDLSEIPNRRRLALSSNLSSIIMRQIEYYFCDDNLAKDNYLRSYMDNQGWVDVFVIAEFARIKSMTNDIQLILSSVRLSTTVDVQCYKLRKRHGWEKWLFSRGTIANNVEANNNNNININ